MWTGQETDPGIWDDFRFALQGYCGERGLSYLIRDEVKKEEANDNDNDNDLLMSIILRSTRGEAGKIVRPFAKRGDGTSAWRALAQHYGNECKDRRQARIIECAKMLEKTACRSKEDITSMVVELDHIFSEFEELGCPYPSELKKVTLLTKLQPAAGEIYGCIIKDADMTYEKTTASVRRMAAFDGAVDRANKRTEPELGAYHGNAIRNQNGLVTNQVRGNVKKSHQGRPKKGKAWGKAWTPAWDQCLWCLKKGHRYAACPGKLCGEPSRVRPDGTHFEDHTNNSDLKTTSLLAHCLLSHVQPNKENPNPNPNPKYSRKWLVDSGCNRHMTPHKEDFAEFVEDRTVCKFGNNEKSEAKGRGKVTMECRCKNGNHIIVTLSDVLYIPSLPHRMFSSGRLREKKGEFRETEGDSTIRLPLSNERIPLLEAEGFLWLCETRHGQHETTNMTEIDAKHVHKTRDNEAIVSTVYAPGDRESAQASMMDWHETLGHTHPASILFLEQRGLINITGMKNIDDFHCRTCKETKSTIPHYQRGTRSIKKPGEVVHVDLVGPFEVDMNGYRHMMVFIDEATRFKNVMGLKNKGEAHRQLKSYTEGMQLAGITVDCIRGDGAGELGRSRIFRQELKDLALRWESSPPYTHQQQGLVERAIRQVVEGGRTQLGRSYLGNDYWFYACQDFTFKSNCLPHQSLGGDSPYERLHPGRKPRYQAFKKFGQTAYVHIDKTRRGELSRGRLNKMRPRSERGTLVGHTMGASAYLVYLPRLKKIVTSSAVVCDDIPAEIPFLSERPEHWTSPAPGFDDAAHLREEDAEPRETNGIENTRDSVFDGRDITRQHRKLGAMESCVKVEETEVIPTQEDEPEDQVEPGHRKSSRLRVQFDPQHMPSGTREMEELNRLVEEESDDDEGNNPVQCMLADTCTTIEEAMAGPDADSWRKAIETEDRGLEEKGVLSPEECPKKMKPLKTKYVLTKKTAPDGRVIKFKARRVVQGFNQVYGRDFIETFSPVIGFDTLRIIIKMMVEHGWKYRTMDFTQAYLNAPLKEMIYVKNPDGSTSRLNKALYGLKQAGTEWSRTLKDRIVKRGTWKQSEHDSCLFFTLAEGKKIAIIAIYVDDLLITGSWEEEIERVQKHLLEDFEGRAEKTPCSYLGLQIDKNEDVICLHQTEYCKDIVKMVFDTPTRGVHTPLDPGADLAATREGEEALDLDTYPYRQVLGKLMYLSHMTRPDICNAVRELGRNMHSPCIRHWRSLQHLLKYLDTHSRLGTSFKREGLGVGLQLKGYSDADLAGDQDTRRSCIGYVILLGNSPVTWSSRTEKSILLSTAESEWTAMARGIRHVNFLKGILGELETKQGKTPWFCDNQAAIVAAKTSGFNGRTRHVDIKLKFTRQEHELGKVEILYVPTDEQLADGLTKKLRRDKNERMVLALLDPNR